MDRLLRIRDAADAIGFKETKTRQLIKQGRLQAVTVDGRLRVPSHSIDQFVLDQVADAGGAVGGSVRSGHETVVNTARSSPRRN